MHKCLWQKPHEAFRGGRGAARWIVFLTLAVVASTSTAFISYRSPVEINFGVVEPPVIAQKDITIRERVSAQNPEQKPLECSSIVWFEDRLVLTSDRHGHALFSLAIDPQSMQIDLPHSLPVIRNEQELLDDAEAITIRSVGAGRAYVYVMCSLSNDRTELPLPKRRHMMRALVNHAADGKLRLIGSPRVLNLSPVREAVNEVMKSLSVDAYETYYSEFSGEDRNTYRWGNVEGITFVPGTEHRVMLCGMRNPLYNDDALLFTMEQVDAAFDAEVASKIQVTDVFAIDLQGRGISDLTWDPRTKGYLITAAKSNGPKLDDDQPFPPNSLDSAIFWWSGVKKEQPQLIARVPDMKVESICRLGDSPYVAFATDEGDVSEGRTERQSVLTVMVFDGFDEAGSPANE